MTVHLIDPVPSLGDQAFLARLERATKRTLRPRKRGPKPRPQDEARLI